MLKYKYKMYIIFSIFFIGLVALISVWLYPNYTEVDIILFLISSVSLTISFIALLISLNTYFSIDAVNKVTRMEGNLLENDQYSLSLAELLIEYDEENPTDLANKLFDDLKKRFEKDSKTAIDFTDHLQHFVDVLIFFPAIFNSADSGIDYNHKKNELMKVMKISHANMKELVSTGDFIQVDEVIKLIEGVMAYQNFYEKKDLDPSVELLKVRGSILKNNVTKTVYFNYLGLFYNKKALVAIRKVLNLEGIDLLEKEKAKLVYDQLHNKTKNEKEDIRTFLLESVKCFETATIYSEGDIMWRAYIEYNKGRTLFYLQCLDHDKHTGWLDILNQSLASRKKLNMLIDQFMNKRKSHLSHHYKYQELLAKLVSINLQYATGEIKEEDLEFVSNSQFDYSSFSEYNAISKYRDDWINSLNDDRYTAI